MSGFEVRPAGPADLGGVEATTAALSVEDSGARDRLRDQSWPRRHGAEWLAGLVEDADALLLVAVIENSVVGHLVGAHTPASSMWLGGRAELVSMYVAPHMRGQGVGSRLVEAFIAWARTRGAVRLHVTAYTENRGALRFYARHGFRPLSTVLAADLHEDPSSRKE